MALRSEHLNEFQVMEQVRPDPVAAPTAMTVPATTKYYVSDFGVKTVPVGYSYLTPVSGDDRGETATTLTSTPVTIGGSTYTHTLKVSDRTHGPFEFDLTITGTGATTLSWLVNGRASGDSGTGASYQPGEYYFERHGTADQAFGNPTRDGQTAVRWTPNGENPFPYVAYPERDTRTHSGRSLYYSAVAETFESCVHPMDFMSPEEQFAGRDNPPFPVHGDTATASALWYGHRCNQRLQMRWGSTDAVRAVTHRVDTWTYAPTPWDGANDSGPLVLGRFSSRYLRPMQFDEAKAYDLDNFGSPITMASFAITPGVDNYNQYIIQRNFIITTIDNGVPPAVTSVLTRTPTASRYVAVVVRNTSTDIAVAVALRLADEVPTGSGLISTLGDNSFVSLGNFVDAPFATGAITEPYVVLLNPNCKSTRRAAGWIGTTEYCCIGLTAHVLAAVQALRANGDLDLDPIPPPGAAIAGTVFDREEAGVAPASLTRVRNLVRQRWERAGV